MCIAVKRKTTGNRGKGRHWAAGSASRRGINGPESGQREEEEITTRRETSQGGPRGEDHALHLPGEDGEVLRGEREQRGLRGLQGRRGTPAPVGSEISVASIRFGPSGVLILEEKKGGVDEIQKWSDGRTRDNRGPHVPVA